MSTRPPSDAVVALRSLDRRFRSAFADPGDGRPIDDLASANGPDGHSAIDHLMAATRIITVLGRALDQTLREDDPVLHPAVAEPTKREWPEVFGSVEDRLAELARDANALADRAARVSAEDWGRHARVAGADADVSATSILWDAVDSVLDHLRAAEQALH